VFRATLCAAFLVLSPIIVVIGWLREKKSLWDEERGQSQEKARQKREGLRKRQDYDIVVDASEWDPTLNGSCWTRWVEGEIRQLLPGDTVLKWGGNLAQPVVKEAVRLNVMVGLLLNIWHGSAEHRSA
jgi:hypothetical protein